MKKNIVIAVSWCIMIALLVGLWRLWEQFSYQNSTLRNLRADLCRQQVSERQKQMKIAKRLYHVDDSTRHEVINLLIESAAEVDQLRDQNDIWNGKDELAILKQGIEQSRPQPSPTGDVTTRAAPEK